MIGCAEVGWGGVGCDGIRQPEAQAVMTRETDAWLSRPDCATIQNKDGLMVFYNLGL